MANNKLLNKKASSFLHLADIGKSGTNTLHTYNDPVFFEFHPIFHFSAKSGLLASEDNVNSALAHLKRIGEDARYALLKNFISMLSRICDEAPWMFRSVLGLDEINMVVSEPRFVEKKLVFEMFESVDFRTNALIDSLRSTVFSYDYFTDVLPRNLQHFSMSVAVTDARVLQGDLLGNNFRLFGRDENNMGVGIDKLAHKMFHFGKCRFSETMGQSKFSDIRNDEYQGRDSELVVEYKVHAYSSRFMAITGDVDIGGGVNGERRGKVYDDVEGGRFAPVAAQLGRIRTIATDLVDFDAQGKRLKGIVDDAIDTGIQYGADVIGTHIDRVVLGNVYQDDIADVLRLFEATSFEEVKNVFYG